MTYIVTCTITTLAGKVSKHDQLTIYAEVHPVNEILRRSSRLCKANS